MFVYWSLQIYLHRDQTPAIMFLINRNDECLSTRDLMRCISQSEPQTRIAMATDELTLSSISKEYRQRLRQSDRILIWFYLSVIFSELIETVIDDFGNELVIFNTNSPYDQWRACWMIFKTVFVSCMFTPFKKESNVLSKIAKKNK